MSIFLEKMVQLVDDKVDKQKSHLQEFVFEKVLERETQLDHAKKIKVLQEFHDKFIRFDHDIFEDREKICSFETRVFEMEKKLKLLQTNYSSE